MSTPELWSLPVTELARGLAAREFSSEEVTSSQLARIEAADEAVGAFVTRLAATALDEARAQDRARASGEALGPLAGVPISVKESIDVEGFASTLGVESRATRTAKADAALVGLMRAAGCIPVGRTNVSQLLLFHEARNPLYGQTNNPWSRAHSPGGSSGGESAAVAAGMSAIGLGGDIGGSVRVPAHFAGVAAIKPTLDRLPNRGSRGALAGQEAVRSQVGLFTRTAAELAFVWESLDFARASELDPRTPPLPAAPSAGVSLEGLRFAVFEHDGLVAPSRSLVRALSVARAALEARGAKAVTVAMPGVADAVFDYFAALSSDGGDTVGKALEGSKTDASLRSLRAVAALPEAVRRAGSRAAALAGQPLLSRLLAVVGRKSVGEFWAIVERLREFRGAVLDAWAASGAELVLAPPFATPALPHGGSQDFALAGSAAMLWNAVQFPAGVVPVTRVRADESAEGASRGRDALSKKADAVDAASAGLPVGAQVIAKPWREDLVLAAMRAVEEHARATEGPNAVVTPVTLA